LVKGTNKGTSTDFDGNFSLSLEKGTYTLVVSVISKPKELEINLTKDTHIEIDMSDIFVNLDEVLFSAVRVKPSSPVTHSNVSKEELESRNLGQDIPILLNYLPSVVTTSDAGAGIGYTGIRVRGSDATRVNITINGIPYNDAESHGTFWVNLPDFASSTENMQLQRGVGTSTNGSGAFGASLNLLTDAISEKATAEIASTVGSYNTYKNTVKFSTGKINDHIEFAGRFSKIDSDGYVDRAWSDLKSYFLQAAYTDDNTLIKAITFGGHEKTYQAWYGLSAEELEEDRRQNPYTYENEIDNYQQDHYQLHWNQGLNEKWSSNLALNYTLGKGYYEQFREDDGVGLYNGIVLATGTDWYGGPATDLIRRRWLDNSFFVANASLNYAGTQTALISGFSYSHYDGDHFGEVIWAREFAADANIRDHYYDSNTVKNDFNIFSKMTYDISDVWELYADLQMRFVGVETSGLTSDRVPIEVDENYTFFNPKAGFTYTVNAKNSIYLSYAKASKEPNRNDFEQGATKAEKLHDFEFGWRLKGEKIELNTNLYYMNYKDQLVLTGDIDDTGAFIRRNVDNSFRAGIEIDSKIALTPTLAMQPSLTLSTNKIKDFMLERDGNFTNLGNTNIAFSPELIMGNALVYRPNNRFQASLLSKYIGEQYLSNTDTEASKLEGYFVNDLNLNYTFNCKKVFKSIAIRLLINNVFDELYVSNGYTYLDFWSTPGNSFEVQGYYPQATRNFLAGITFKF
jgi:iron complex outermembrane receptor protein